MIVYKTNKFTAAYENMTGVFTIGLESKAMTFPYVTAFLGAFAEMCELLRATVDGMIVSGKDASVLFGTLEQNLTVYVSYSSGSVMIDGKKYNIPVRNHDQMYCDVVSIVNGASAEFLA